MGSWVAAKGAKKYLLVVGCGHKACRHTGSGVVPPFPLPRKTAANAERGSADVVGGGGPDDAGTTAQDLLGGFPKRLRPEAAKAARGEKSKTAGSMCQRGAPLAENNCLTIPKLVRDRSRK